MRQIVRYTGIVILLLCGVCAYGQRLSVGDLYEDGEDRGIIFWVSRDKTEAWIVAMEDSEGPCEWDGWIMNSLLEVRPEVFRETVSGYENTRIIRDILGEGDQHPAQRVDFERGWYLPAIGQLIRLAEQADAVNAALRVFGGEELSEAYFSSNVDWLDAMVRMWITYFIITGSEIETYVRAVKTVQLGRRDYTCLWSPGNETSHSVTVEPERGRNDYAVTLTSLEGGCTTTLTRSVMVATADTMVFRDTVCRGQTYSEHGFHTAVAGRHELTVPVEGGCSLHTRLELQVADTFYREFYDHFCVGSRYTAHGLWTDRPGRYVQRWQSQQGCDSTVVVNLTGDPVYRAFFTADVCRGASYAGYGFNVDRVDRDTLLISRSTATLTGCDSVTELLLTVRPAYEQELNDTVCRGGSYVRGEEVLVTAAERDTVIRYQAAGEVCDTNVTLWLTVVPKPERWEPAAICEGEHYRKYGLDKRVSEDFDVTVAGSRGCDTLVHVSLRVYLRTEVRLSDSVCYGDRYSRYPWWRSPVVTRDTQLQVHLSSAWGCDSLVVVSLRCLPLPRKGVEDTIVTGEVYTAYGLSATESGIYPVRLAGVGCDTLLEVALTVKKPYEQRIEATVCKGQRYREWGFDVTEPGEYRRKVKGPGHNDTVYYLSLRQLSSYNFLVERGICRGEGVAFGGMVYTEEGVYPRYFLTSAGCDSTVTLRLQVNEYAEGEVVADLVDCRRHEYHFGVELSSGSGELDYVWELGDGTGAEAKEVVHQYADTGWQEVKVRITTSAGCSREARQKVYVPYYPHKLTVEADPAGVDEKNLFLTFRTAALPGMRYDWDFGDGTAAFGAGAEVRHLYSLTDEKGFEVKVRLTNSDDCVAEAGLNIRAYPSFVVPNTFSPNDDGTNDVFMPGYRVRIVNRLGRQVYEGADGWDGTDGGQKAQEDTYFYELWYETLYGQKTQTGYITLVR